MQAIAHAKRRGTPHDRRADPAHRDGSTGVFALRSSARPNPIVIAVAALRVIDPQVRILGSSGNAPLEGLSEADGLRFVAKPYTSATLVAALRRLLDAPA